jgi:hypothetical protein
MTAIGDGANDSARSAVNYGDQRLVPGSTSPPVSRVSIPHMDLHLMVGGGPFEQVDHPVARCARRSARRSRFVTCLVSLNV